MKEKRSLRLTLTGVPNVGKSTLFNSLTGMKVHTGNWSGKTVESSVGAFEWGGYRFSIEDLPGAYSLTPFSPEEKIAFSALFFSSSDVNIIVCDESRLFSNMNFIVQALEVSKRAIVCLNFCEAAEKEGRKIDTHKLSELLGVPVVRVNARKKRSLEGLLRTASEANFEKRKNPGFTYKENIEKSIARISEIGEKFNTLPSFSRRIAINALSGDREIAKEFCRANVASEEEMTAFLTAVDEECKRLFTNGYTPEMLRADINGAVCERAEEIFDGCALPLEEKKTLSLADKLMTGRIAAFPVMLLLLGAVMIVTLKLASYPSEALQHLFEGLNFKIRSFMEWAGAERWLVGAVCDGALSTLFTVVAVMLPPMAFFFPFFTLLEDSGYLPRVAYNLDRPFAACGSCGKQSLTMCMGLGCNAVGITGARIIPSRKERLIAIVTNSFIPCNGRFPMLVALISVFFVSAAAQAAVLVLLILIAFAVTFGVTYLLSHTVLKGNRSFFVLELPPYRRPSITHVLVRSLYDRTLKLLARAAAVALPCGILIWCLSNIYINSVTPINLMVEFFDPIGRFMGLDGVMLCAFVLGLPANETVLPIALSIYGAEGTVSQVLLNNGWTLTTAVCAMLFTLFHWPCSTSIITVKKETRSWRWTWLSVILPTAIGVILTSLVAAFSRLAGGI